MCTSGPIKRKNSGSNNRRRSDGIADDDEMDREDDYVRRLYAIHRYRYHRIGVINAFSYEYRYICC